MPLNFFKVSSRSEVPPLNPGVVFESAQMSEVKPVRAPVPVPVPHHNSVPGLSLSNEKDELLDTLDKDDARSEGTLGSSHSPTRLSPTGLSLSRISSHSYSSFGRRKSLINTKKASSNTERISDSETSNGNILKRVKKNKSRRVGRFGLNTFTPIEAPDLLPGEQIHDSTKEVHLHYYKNWYPGALHVTNFRLLFKPYVLSSYDDVPRIANATEYCSVPLSSIYRVEKIGGETSRGENGYLLLEIWTKDMKHLRFTFKVPDRNKSMAISDIPARETRKRIAKLLKVEIEISNFFAYKYECPPISLKDVIEWENSLNESVYSQNITDIENDEIDPDAKFDGWELYNPYTEYGIRQGILCDMETRHKNALIAQVNIRNRLLYGRSKKPYERVICTNPIQKWRTCNLNKNYEISESYPKIFCVPDMMTDEEVRAAAAFRSKGRIPVLSWCDPNGGASLTRSAQPLIGMVPIKRKGKVQDDQRMIELIIGTNPTVRSLMIVDLRPKINADANKLFKGAGYEKNYMNCDIRFMNIDNIHAMRSSFAKLCEFCLHSGGSDTLFYTNLESTKWLDHIRVTLRAALFCVMCIEGEKKSVLVHCSDGWDRTSQVTSLTMLMLDPYYRTMEGFCLLIEKEWCSFGHQFHKRIGPGSKNYFMDDRGPIFLQFCECVYQLLHQHPTAFEFTDKFLLFILDEVFSSRFGTFLFDSERERTMDPELDVTKKTPSLWTFLLHPKERQKHKNPFYDPSEKTTSRSIAPDLRKSHLRLWTDFWFRYLVPSNTMIFPYQSHSHFHRLYAFFQSFPAPRDALLDRCQEYSKTVDELRDEKLKTELKNSTFANELTTLWKTTELLMDEKRLLESCYSRDTELLLRICDEQRQELRKWRDGASLSNIESNLMNLIQLENEASQFMVQNEHDSTSTMSSFTQHIKELHNTRTKTITEDFKRQLDEQKVLFQRETQQLQKQIEQLKQEKLELSNTIKRQQIQIESLLPESSYDDEIADSEYSYDIAEQVDQDDTSIPGDIDDFESTLTEDTCAEN